MTRKKRELHGMWHSPTYKAWAGMIERCSNPRRQGYENYGGRGIAVCARWRNSFLAFVRDMGERPEALSLDRFPNNDGNYEPGNCRWATREEQNRNKRAPKANRSGVKGVRWTSDRGVFRVHIHANGKLNHIGATPDFFEAVCLRKSAELRFHNPASKEGPSP